MYRFFYNLIFLKNKYMPHNRKMRLGRQYLYFTLKHFIKRKLGMKPKHEVFCNYWVQTTDYHMLYNLFEEIFVKNEYWFHADNDSPKIIDCGSNIGMSALYFKYIYPNSDITCFEPSPENFEVLEDNVSMNKLEKVTTINAAVDYDEGKLDFLEVSEGGVTSQLVGDDAKLGANKGIVKVDVVKLSNYIFQEIDLLKLDVEGSEFGVIKDLVETKKIKFINNMIIEWYHHQHGKATNLSEFLGFLEKNDFEYMISARTYGSFEKSGSQTILIYVNRQKPLRLVSFSEIF